MEQMMLMKVDESPFDLSTVELRMQRVPLTRALELPLKALEAPSRFEACLLSGWAHSRKIERHHHHHLHLFYG